MSQNKPRFSKANLARYVGERVNILVREHKIDTGNGTSQCVGKSLDFARAYGRFSALRDLWDEFELPPYLTTADTPPVMASVSRRVERRLTAHEETTVPADAEWVSSYGDEQLTMVDRLPSELLRKAKQYVTTALPVLPITEEGNRLFDSMMAECGATIKKRVLPKKQ